MSVLGEIIRWRREGLGLTQKDVAQRMVNSKGKAVSRPYISKLETGEVTRISAEYLAQLAKALEMDYVELMVAISSSSDNAKVVVADVQEISHFPLEKEVESEQEIAVSNPDDLLVTVPPSKQTKPSKKLNDKPHKDLPDRKVKLYFAPKIPQLSNPSTSALLSEDRVFVIPECWNEEDIVALQEWVNWRSWNTLQKKVFPVNL